MNERQNNIGKRLEMFDGIKVDFSLIEEELFISITPKKEVKYMLALIKHIKDKLKVTKGLLLRT